MRLLFKGGDNLTHDAIKYIGSATKELLKGCIAKADNEIIACLKAILKSVVIFLGNKARGASG